MEIPHVRDRVRVEGHEGIFRVVLVDEQRLVADLAYVDRVGFLPLVPLELIYPVKEPDGKKP